MRVRNDYWPSSSSRPWSILIFLYSKAINWLNKKSRILRSEDDQTVQRTQELLDILEDGPDLLTTFDEALFSELVEMITIQDNSTIRFRLINGLELPEHIERKK